MPSNRHRTDPTRGISPTRAGCARSPRGCSRRRWGDPVWRRSRRKAVSPERRPKALGPGASARPKATGHWQKRRSAETKLGKPNLRVLLSSRIRTPRPLVGRPRSRCSHGLSSPPGVSPSVPWRRLHVSSPRGLAAALVRRPWPALPLRVLPGSEVGLSLARLPPLLRFPTSSE